MSCRRDLRLKFGGRDFPAASCSFSLEQEAHLGEPNQALHIRQIETSLDFHLFFT